MAARRGHDSRAAARALDVHESLKHEIFGAPQAACDAHFEKGRPCPAGPRGVSDQYLVLDTYSKLRASRADRGEFAWNFMVQGATGDEVVGVRDTIETVIAIQIGGFALPIPPEVPYTLAAAPAASPSGLSQLVLVHNNANALPPFNPLLAPTQYPASAPAQTPWVSNPYSQLPYGGRITIQLREAGLQSYSDRGGARHNFELAVDYFGAGVGNPNMLVACPPYGHQWDTYVFTEPLMDVHGLTLVFRNPDVPVRFLPDCLYDTVAEGDGAAAPGPFLRFRAPGHGLLAGDRVMVTGYASGVPALDAYVNRPEGHVAAGDPQLPPLVPAAPIPTADDFWLDPCVGLVDLAALPASQTVTVYVAKRRMRIPVRIRRVVPRLTNYLST